MSVPSDLEMQLERLIGQPGVSADYVRFRVDLLQAQRSVLEVLAARESPAPRNGNGPEASGAAVRPEFLPIDPALLGQMVTRLAESVRRRGQSNDQIDRLAFAAGEPAVLAELARAAAFGPDEARLGKLVERIGLPLEGLLFFGRVLAAPFVMDAIRRFRARGGTAFTVSSSSCVWCGSPPTLAIIGEDGQRELCCSLCGESWRYERIRCVFCGASEALGSLTLAATEGLSVETCDACKTYLKVLDQRKVRRPEPPSALVETIATLWLDLIAEKEDYVGPPPHAGMQ